VGPLFYAYERIEMSKSETYVKRTEEFLEKLSGELEFEVVDVEFVKEAGEYYLRAYCDMEGGIGIEDCAEISRRLSDWLDENDFIDEGYILEVSSPGLGRTLKKDKDFVREMGKESGYAFILNSDNNNLPFVNTAIGEDITDALISVLK